MDLHWFRKLFYLFWFGGFSVKAVDNVGQVFSY